MCLYWQGEPQSTTGFAYLLPNDYLEGLTSGTCFLLMNSHNCSANTDWILCREPGVWHLECSPNPQLLLVTAQFPKLENPSGKTRRPLVSLSIPSLRPLDQCHGNQERLEVGRRGVCGCRPPHLTLSGTRCLWQVLALCQIEFLSECGQS